MRLPKMKYVENRSQKQIMQFLGVNYGENTRDGELAESHNLSSRMFPCLSQRQGREVGVQSYEKATAVWYRDGLMVVDGIDLLYNGVKVGTVSEGKKQFANVNTKVVIFPDKVMYDIESNEMRSLEAEYTSGENALEFTDEKNLKVHLGSYRAEIIGSGTLPGVTVWKHQSDKGNIIFDTPAFEYQLIGHSIDEENGAVSYESKIVIPARNVTEGVIFSDSKLGLDGLKSWGKVSKITKETYGWADPSGYSESGEIWKISYDRYEVKGTHYRFEVSGSGTIGQVLSHQVTGSGNIPYDVYVYDYKINSLTLDAGNGEVTAVKGERTPAGYVSVGDYFVAANLGIDGVTKWGQITSIEETQPDTNWNVGRSFKYNILTVVSGKFEGFIGFEEMNFRVGDTVEITGCVTYPQNNKTLTIRGMTKTESGAGTVYGLTFDPQSFAKGTEAGAVTIKRSVPNLTVICEKDNRLYGAEGDTIYVSALGDPTNMKTYDGIDTDSYTVAVATEGDFTGCIGYGSSVLFFKEDCMHKLMGSYPSQYALYDYTIPGVVKGSEGSLCNINEVVYYHGREGVYRYAGGSPELISANFGLRRFDTAAAGAQGEHYYISMRDKSRDTWGLWVYDIRNGIWLQEDDTQAVDFARDGGRLYFISSEGRLVLVNPESSEEQIKWSATLCVMNEVYLNRKCYSKILMRLEIDEGAEMKIEVACDGGEFVEHQMFTRGAHRTANVPIRHNRCDSFQIRLSGTGRTCVRAIVREFELGSDY